MAINKLRETLCDSVEHPRFIETVPRAGYRFIASLNVAASQLPGPAAVVAAAAPLEATAPANEAAISECSAVPPSSAAKPAWSGMRYVVVAATVLLCLAGAYAVRRTGAPAPTAAPSPRRVLLRQRVRES